MKPRFLALLLRQQYEISFGINIVQFLFFFFFSIFNFILHNFRSYVTADAQPYVAGITINAVPQSDWHIVAWDAAQLVTQQAYLCYLWRSSIRETLRRLQVRKKVHFEVDKPKSYF